MSSAQVAQADPVTAATAEIVNLKLRIRALNATNINLKRRIKELEALVAKKEQ